MARGSEIAFSVALGHIGQVISVSPHRVRRFKDQPRKNFNKKKLEGLARSISPRGFLFFCYNRFYEGGIRKRTW